MVSNTVREPMSMPIKTLTQDGGCSAKRRAKEPTPTAKAE